ncbi:ATP-binding cassette domain-containing protein [Paenibacillus caseinilyticus]|uniref:UDP-N-acetylglucosamine kinase n=1 Tax=Paenibacillus mucilaginosus K02 TaxID=997761 RepID=I0BRB9_9BACL|nr:ATP-binding cassette domain-containing protein [Paenibacillus mucilaginosus]AFH64916.1 hypothetical protein B2K_30150 [Paenibacillus mucilaginosus K02]
MNNEPRAAMLVFAGNNGSGKSTIRDLIIDRLGVSVNIVRSGGHHIDSKDIIRREQTSLSNLLAHLQLIDHLIVIDNSSSDGQIVLETDSTTVKCYSKALPGWLKPFIVTCKTEAMIRSKPTAVRDSDRFIFMFS